MHQGVCFASDRAHRDQLRADLAESEKRNVAMSADLTQAALDLARVTEERDAARSESDEWKELHTGAHQSWRRLPDERAAAQAKVAAADIDRDDARADRDRLSSELAKSGQEAFALRDGLRGWKEVATKEKARADEFEESWRVIQEVSRALADADPDNCGTLRERVLRMHSDLARAREALEAALNYCPFCSKGARCRAAHHDMFRAALSSAPVAQTNLGGTGTKLVGEPAPVAPAGEDKETP